MTYFAAISSVQTRAADAAFGALREEFGDVMAARILDAEAVNFLWDARVKERYLGQYLGCDFSADDAEDEFCRMAILSSLSGRWHVALCLVDGEGAPIELLWKREFGGLEEAEFALRKAC